MPHFSEACGAFQAIGVRNGSATLFQPTLSLIFSGIGLIRSPAGVHFSDVAVAEYPVAPGKIETYRLRGCEIRYFCGSHGNHRKFRVAENFRRVDRHALFRRADMVPAAGDCERICRAMYVTPSELTGADISPTPFSALTVK